VKGKKTLARRKRRWEDTIKVINVIVVH
jgi:hypothetical protein